MKFLWVFRAVIICITLVASIAGYSQSISLPKNAQVNVFNTGWECNRGYQRQGNECSRMSIPANAQVNVFNTGWECNRGFKKVSEECIPMSAAEIEQQQIYEARLAAMARSSRYNYDVSGYGDTGYVTGNIDASSNSKSVSGYLYLENGDEVYFDGEFTGNGIVEGYDENGNYYYDLEVD